MDEKDTLLSKAWHEADHPVPPPELDARILAAAREAVVKHKPRRSAWLRFGLPVSTAAVMVLAIALALHVEKAPYGPLDHEGPPIAQYEAEPEPEQAASVPAKTEDPAVAAHARQEATDLSGAARSSTAATGVKRAAPEATSTLSDEATPLLPPQADAKIHASEEARAEGAVPSAAMQPAAPAAKAQSPSLQNEASRGTASRLDAMEPARAPVLMEKALNEELAAIRELIRAGNTAEAKRRLGELLKRQPGLKLPDDLRALAASP